MANDQLKGKQVVLVSDPAAAIEDSPVVKYFMENKPYVVSKSLHDVIVDKLRVDRAAAFYVSLNDYRYLDDLLRRYPAATVRRTLIYLYREIDWTCVSPP
jgi:hypothetical protein